MENSLNGNVLNELLERGTFKDKIFSLKKLIQKNGDFNKHFDSLIELIIKNKRRESYIAIQKTAELFCELSSTCADLKPDNGSDYSGLENNGLNFNENISNCHLKFLNALKIFLNDKIPKIRINIIGLILDMLRSISLNISLSVNLIVNKFVDSSNQVSAHAQNLLHKYVHDHHEHAHLIVQEILTFLTRVNLGFKPRYYSICFLNQIRLDKTNNDLADILVNCYLNIFNNHCAESDPKSQLAHALLTGLTRALPFSSKNSDDSRSFAHSHTQLINKIFTHAQSKNISAAVRAMIILLKLKDKKPEINDKYFKTLFNLIFRERISGENHSIMLYFNLIYKSILSEKNKEKQKILIKQILQISLHSSPEFCCSSFLLISDIFNDRNKIKYLLSKFEDDEDKNNIQNENISSWDFKNLNSNITDEILNEKFTFSNCSLWEIVLMNRHYHASVKPMLDGFTNCNISYSGDSLVDFTHTAFIDRFINRQPKLKNVCASNPKSTYGSNAKEDTNGYIFPEQTLLNKFSECKSSTENKTRKRRRNNEDDVDSGDDFDETFSKKFKNKKH